MVKRSLIAIAVLALLTTSVQALDDGGDGDGRIKRDGAWPTVYVALDLCTMPVVMDVGMYVQIFECEKRIIKLVQVPCGDIEKGDGDFPCYLDCEEFDIRANFTAVLGTKLTKAEGSPITDWAAYYDGEDTVPGDGVYYKRTVCVKAWKTEIWTAGPGDEVAVGSLTITVKPN